MSISSKIHRTCDDLRRDLLHAADSLTTFANNPSTSRASKDYSATIEYAGKLLAEALRKDWLVVTLRVYRRSNRRRSGWRHWKNESEDKPATRAGFIAGLVGC